MSRGTGKIGDATEERVDLELEDEGYIVDKRKGRKFQAQDTFGCLDRLAIKADSPVRAVQATTGSQHAGDRKRKVEAGIGMVYKPGSALTTHLVVEVWTWDLDKRSGREGFKKERYLGEYGKNAWVTTQERGTRGSGSASRSSAT